MKYLRRFVWYLASRLLLICVVLGLMVVAFYYAMNMANIYVVLKDGMAYRAQVVMMEADESELTKYFMPSFLEQDQVLLATKQGNSPYKDYNVRGIDHRLEMEWMWCWPWEDTARANIIERIPPHQTAGPRAPPPTPWWLPEARMPSIPLTGKAPATGRCWSRRTASGVSAA